MPIPLFAKCHSNNVLISQVMKLPPLQERIRIGHEDNVNLPSLFAA